MSYSAGSVATMVFTRMTGINSTISGNMISLASGAIIDIGQAVGQTLDCTNVPENYFNAAINLTALYARVAMDGGACSFDMGGITLTKGVSPQAEFFKQEVERALKRKPVLFQKIYS